MINDYSHKICIPRGDDLYNTINGCCQELDFNEQKVKNPVEI